MERSIFIVLSESAIEIELKIGHRISVRQFLRQHLLLYICTSLNVPLVDCFGMDHATGRSDATEPQCAIRTHCSMLADGLCAHGERRCPLQDWTWFRTSPETYASATQTCMSSSTLTSTRLCLRPRKHVLLDPLGNSRRVDDVARVEDELLAISVDEDEGRDARAARRIWPAEHEGTCACTCACHLQQGCLSSEAFLACKVR